MNIIKIKSKSNPSIYRTVRIIEGIDGQPIYQCDCPANTWYRISNGRHGKAVCSHIQQVLDNLTKAKK